MNQDPTTIPDWKLERYVLGELPKPELESIRKRTESDELLQTRLRALEQSDAEVRSAYPTGEMTAGIRRRLNGSERSEQGLSSRWVWAALPAAAAIILFVYPTTHRDELDGNRIKGGDSALFLYRKTADGVEELKNGDIASEHDLIQIKYKPGTLRYGVILSIDGRGTVTVHLPESGKSASELKKGKADTLSFSYELDDAPARERFFFVSSDTPFEVRMVLDAAKSIAFSDGELMLALPGVFSQYIFTLKKDTGHAY